MKSANPGSQQLDDTPGAAEKTIVARDEINWGNDHLNAADLDSTHCHHLKGMIFGL